MYDEQTASLIRSAPALGGLDLERLPERLSDAFAKIAAARVRLREGDVVDEDVVSLIGEMQRLALTNEALVATAPDRENRAAAAFVAGSAHQVCFNARSIRNDDDATSYLEPQSISPDLSAMLLFLIAESIADSTELAARINIREATPIERTLIEALRSLAKGELVTITSAALPPRGMIKETDSNAASLALYYNVLLGVRSLASELLMADNSETGTAVAIFRRVVSLALPPNADGKDWMKADLGAFAGPFHLGSLLIAVAGDLAGSAVTSITPPGGVPPHKWVKSVKRVAKTRPYLWRNHRQAIEAGYLEPGISSAVSFPTGAGKSTLAELKIGATLLREQKVIFLAPTNALVGQTTRSLRRAFRNSNVGQERFDELGFLADDEDLPEIFVMTPESCLAQMSIAPSVFEGVGLLVFDECHLLHADNGDGRRALDAMLCILNFAALVPEADFLLLSAMMKNAAEISGWVGDLTGRKCLPLDLPWKPTRQLRGCVVYSQNEVAGMEAGLKRARAAKKTRESLNQGQSSANERPASVLWAQADVGYSAEDRLLACFSA